MKKYKVEITEEALADLEQLYKYCVCIIISGKCNGTI